ncbi:MAG: orotidine 5'-phosphate decarboxylase [Acidobacteriota bacterium]
MRLARVAADSRLDGVVSSPLEVGRLRSAGLTDLSFVTPGIRPSSGADRDDQKRVTTAFDAIRAGATYLVVGRPVIKADDPLSAAQALLKEIESAILV